MRQAPGAARRVLPWLGAAALLSALVVAGTWLRQYMGRMSVSDRLEQFEQPVRERLAGDFDRASVTWPAGQITLVGIKNRRRLELYARNGAKEPWRYVKAWPILAASGGPGPKLREGDKQVPEGIYPVESLNPNSRFHLAVRIGYPNCTDRRVARKQGRENLGGDIMIHGSDVSVGCLAMGDRAAEEIFVLVALAGPENTRILLSPVDFRREALQGPEPSPWVREIYDRLAEALGHLPPAGGQFGAQGAQPG
jgi:hypothetical protein